MKPSLQALDLKAGTIDQAAAHQGKPRRNIQILCGRRNAKHADHIGYGQVQPNGAKIGGKAAPMFFAQGVAGKFIDKSHIDLRHKLSLARHLFQMSGKQNGKNHQKGHDPPGDHHRFRHRNSPENGNGKRRMAVQLLHQRVADPVQNNHPFAAKHAALHDKMAQKGSVWHLSSALSFTLFGKQAFPTPLNTGHCFHSQLILGPSIHPKHTLSGSSCQESVKKIVDATKLFPFS